MYLLLTGTLVACRDDLAEVRPLPDYSGEAQAHALLWDGFTQAWGYNHRLNSMGDYVGPLRCPDATCDAEIVHTAASGSGSDTAAWESHHTLVSAPGVGFVQGATALTFDEDDAEGVRLTRSASEAVAAEGLLADPTTVDVVLAGFDVYAIDDADKLRAIRVAVGPAELDDGEIVFDVDVDLHLDCDSPECDGAQRLDHGVRYEVMVAWLVIGGGDALVISEGAEEAEYHWVKAGVGAELDAEEFVLHPTLQGAPGLPVGTPALRGLSVDLDQDHHMVEWASALRPGGYDAATGALDVDLHLLFKQWNQLSAEKLLSYTDEGSATVTADLALIQLAAGCLAEGSQGGEITWIADGGPADDAAVARVPVAFDVPFACTHPAAPPR